MAIVSPYTDNAPTPAPTATVGFKLSKPGYDVNRSSGANLIFNSSWPSLPIAFEVTMTGTGSQVTVPHGLKFAPFSMSWAKVTDASGLTNTSKRTILMSNTTNIYFTESAGITVKIRCFQLDLATDIDYILAQGETTQLPYDSDYGIKVTKQFKDINSKDLRDFAIHSRAQSPLILAVKTEKTMPASNYSSTSGQSFVQYTNKLNYAQWVYGFIKAGTTLSTNLAVLVNTYIYAPYYQQAYPKITTDGIVSYLGFLNTGPNLDNGATIVVLRDPFFKSTQTTVQY